MSLGVACSGCDIGGIMAYAVLSELDELGVAPTMLSVCGLPSVTALLYAAGGGEDTFSTFAEGFLGAADTGDKTRLIRELTDSIDLDGIELPLAVNCIELPSQRKILYSNEVEIESSGLLTYPLRNDMIFSTVAPFEWIRQPDGCEAQLCDYAVKYGIPVYPLTMCGMERTLSVTFLPRQPRTPYQLAMQRILLQSLKGSDAQIVLQLEQPEGKSPKEQLECYIDAVRTDLRKQMDRVYDRVLI